MKQSKGEGGNGRRMLGDREDSFPLLPFSPQCGHLHGVRLIIPYPQTWQADVVTLKACVCMCESRVCVCATLFGCAFLILQPSICLRVHGYAVSPTMRLACVRVSACPCVCVCVRVMQKDRDNTCARVLAFMTHSICLPLCRQRLRPVPVATRHR